MNSNFDFNKLGFVVLNPDCDPYALRKTVNSIKENYPKSSTICIIGKKTVDLEQYNICKVYTGGNTISSLIDKGIENTRGDWSFIVTAGTTLKYNSLKKYIYFLKSDKDIVYPVVDRKVWFYEASINGILINKKAITEVGKMGDDICDLQKIKLLWAMEAIDKGYRFLAIVGARLI